MNRAAINPRDVTVLVFAGPGLGARWEIVRWLAAHGVPDAAIALANPDDRDPESAMNRGLEQVLAPARTWCLMIEGDMRPDSRTNPIWCPPWDFTCVRYPTEAGEFRALTDFHFGIWTCRRNTLAQMPRPFVQFARDWKGVRKGCRCGPFAARARARGLSTGWAGWADHLPRGAVDRREAMNLAEHKCLGTSEQIVQGPQRAEERRG